MWKKLSKTHSKSRENEVNKQRAKNFFLNLRVIQMIIVSLWSICCISRVRRVIVLPVHIHKAVVILMSTRCVETNSEFNTYFVTNGLLVDKKDPNPSFPKTRLISKSKAIWKMMGAASCSTLQTSKERSDESVAVVEIAWVTFKGLPMSKVGKRSERGSEMPNERSTARTVWTKFFSSMYVIVLKNWTTVGVEYKVDAHSPSPGVLDASMIGSLMAWIPATVLKLGSRCERAVITAAQTNARW